QTDGIGLERCGRGDAVVLAGHDAAATTLGVTGSADAVHIQLAAIGPAAAAVLLDQIIEAINHFFARACIRSPCGCDNKTVARPVGQQCAVGAWRGTGAVTPEDDRVLETVIAEGAGPID